MFRVRLYRCNRSDFHLHARPSNDNVPSPPPPTRCCGVPTYGLKKSFSKSITVVTARDRPVDHHPSKAAAAAAAVQVRYVVAIIINRLDYNTRARGKNIII